jgi:hypothetical protein
MASLQEVTQELQTQTKSIDSLVSVIENQINREKAGAGDDLEARLKASRSTSSSSAGSPTTFKGGLVDAVKGDLGLNFMGNLLRWGMGGLSGALGALGVGGLAGTLIPGLGAMLGRLITRGPLGAALLLFGEDLFTKAFDYAGLEQYVTIDVEDKKLYAASLSKAIGSGLIAGIFNKKLGLAVFIGSLLGDGIKGLFSDESLKENFISGFGLNFSKEQFITYGSMFAAFFAPSLIRGALGSALGLGATMLGRGGRSGPGAAPTGKAKAGFLKGFKPRGFKGLGWAGMLMFTGSLLADYIGDLTGSQKAEDLLNIAVTGGSLALMLGTGPVGIGFAIAAMAVHGILLAKKAIDAKRAEMDAEFDKQVALRKLELDSMDPADVATSAMDLAQRAAMNAAAGRRDGKHSAAAANEVAALEYYKDDPKMLDKLFLQEERSHLLAEYESAKLAGNLGMISQTGTAYKAFLKENAELMGIPSSQVRKLDSQLSRLTSTPKAPPGQTTGTFLTMPVEPKLEDFKSWWKGERKENYDFQKALQKYRMDMNELMPPPQIQSGMGAGGGFVNNDNRVSNTGSVTFMQSTATQDHLRGGSSPYSDIAGYGNIR